MGETPDQLKPFLFTTENQPANKGGRPPSILSKLSTITGEDWKLRLSKQQKYEIIEAMLERTVEELIEVEKQTDIPSFMIILAKCILKDIGGANISTVETIFDRVFGKPKQAVDSNLSGKLDFTLKIDRNNHDDAGS